MLCYSDILRVIYKTNHLQNESVLYNIIYNTMAGIRNMLCLCPKQAFKVGRSDHGFFVGLSKTLDR